jgi:hypothetical protein
MNRLFVFAAALAVASSVGGARIDSVVPFAPDATSRPDSNERAAVRRAALDYLEGFYEGDTAKLVRSLSPSLFKYGFWRAKDSTRYAGEQMTYAEAIAYAARFRAQNRSTPATAPREVILLDVLDQIASAKIVAWWGTDYLLLAKYDGRWRILQVLWQGP